MTHDVFDAAGQWVKRVTVDDEATLALNIPEGGSSRPVAPDAPLGAV